VGIETTLTTCFIFAIFIGATVFAYVLRLIGGDELISEFFKGLGLGPTGLVLVVLLVVFIAGFFLDWFEIVLIILPLLAPVIKLAGDRHDLVPDPDRADAADLLPHAAGGFLALLPEGRGAQGRDDRGHLHWRHPLRTAAVADGGAVFHDPRHHHLATAADVWQRRLTTRTDPHPGLGCGPFLCHRAGQALLVCSG
jgi:hypothetical protein